jgi:hypothetical protein
MDDREFSLYLSQNDRENAWINQLILMFCWFWSIIIGIEKSIVSFSRAPFGYGRRKEIRRSTDENSNQFGTHFHRKILDHVLPTYIENFTSSE